MPADIHKAWKALKPERAKILCERLDIAPGQDAVKAFHDHERAQQAPGADTADPAWQHRSFDEKRHAQWVCQKWGLMDGGTSFKERTLADPQSVEPPQCVGTLKKVPNGC
eukprot:COSAG01_NODE_33148_length_569_cov_1.197872_1_plen_109_part_10